MADTQVVIDNGTQGTFQAATYADGSGRHHGKNVGEFIESGAPVPVTTAAPMPVESASRAALNNGATVNVNSAVTPVQLIAADASRTALIIQYIGDGPNVRIGASGVGATTGIQLKPGDSPLIFTGSDTPLNAVYAILETAGAASILAQPLNRV